MRKSLLLVAVVLLAPAVGCKWMEDMRSGTGDQGRGRGRDHKPLDALAPEQGAFVLRAAREYGVQAGREPDARRGGRAERRNEPIFDRIASFPAPPAVACLS